MSQKIETLALHAGQSVDPITGSRALPLHQTSCYVFSSCEQAAERFALHEFGPLYTRLNNPTTDVMEQRLAAIDGGTAALATSSGMSAIFLAITTVCGIGDHIIASASLYGGTDTLFRFTLPRMGIEVTFIEDLTADKIAPAMKDNTKLVYIETIGNPKGDVLDIRAIADVAHANKIPLFIDNTFAPGICKPIEHGCDVVIYSASKWIQGHGTSIAGAIVDAGTFDWSSGRFPEFTTPDESYHGLRYFDTFGNIPGMGNIAFAIKARTGGMRNFGPCISPFNAREVIIGLETLPLRIKQHGINAIKLAHFLKSSPHVAWVNFTGLQEHPSYDNAKKYLSPDFMGAVLGFGIKGGTQAAQNFINKVKLASHVANVGDAKTLVIHPWSTTHQQLTDSAKAACGITEDFIRVSVGIENIVDIIADFEQAMI